ncbi:hypothetical protein PMAYCL1PPCAC_10134, partial [Pristionchus mayeri]
RMSRQARHLQCYDGLAPLADIKKCIKHGHSVLILMRGPPGCGKSHLAEELRAYRTLHDEDTRQPIVLSTDRFFMTPKGRYAFDSSRLEEFHKKNRDEARAAMENNQSPVIIDNTNMQLAHMKQYINIALKSCYEIYVLDPCTPWRHDVHQLAKRNNHFVDERSIDAMLASFEPILRFADLLKPVEFVISRVDLSDDESDAEGGNSDRQMVPLTLNSLPPLTTSNGSEAPITVSTLPLPPGLFSPMRAQQLQQASPIISMSHEPLLSVHQRDVGCQATPAIGLLLEMKRGEAQTPLISTLCFSPGDIRVSSRRRGITSVDAETEAARPPPNPIEIVTAAFPKVPVEDVEHFAVEYPAGEYAQLLVDMGYEMDYVAPVPWHYEDADRSNRTRKGRHKDVIIDAFIESPATQTSPKKKTSIRKQKQQKTERGEGCGVTADDHSSASLSNEYSYEEKLEPLAAAFTDEDELIAVDVKQPIKNILELFFGHNSRQPDVHMPMWLLRLLHRCARGDLLTRGAVYHEDFPSIDLSGLQNEEVAMQQQLRNDAEIARRLHAEETEKSRRRSSSPTDLFTPDQIRSVQMLRGKYPAADPEQIASLFKEMGFNTTTTLSLLQAQFGEAVPGPAYTLPACILAPPQWTDSVDVRYSTDRALSSSSVSRSSSMTNAAGQSYGQRAAAMLPMQHMQQSQQPPQSRPLPTHLANGRITDVGRMAAANGAGRSQDQVRQDFIALHEKRWERQQRLDEALKKAQSVKDHHTRGYYGQEIRRAKEARIQVEKEIAELAQWWNDNLNSDVIDLHWMLAEQAMQMLRERIDQTKRGRGPKRLTVITGSGNNSVGGKAEIKQRVISMCRSQGYQYHYNNDGCIIINF